ncbi:hypothetical protein [Brassicibacter mesophilus]|uniref:hypothetical protein n=1 Tax=Brassicibacter mesophilus TaxID=745119 RepID=UPI003D1EE3FD
MNESVRRLKRLVSELESYAYCENSKKVIQLSDEIVTIAASIKKEFNSKKSKTSFYDNEYSELEKISSLPFIFKPVTVRNYYEGNYLEKFSEQRTDELKRTGILDLHDKFWTSNNVERGNIFGSIPIELIPKDAVSKLLGMGWEHADVTIYEVVKQMKLTQLINLCDKNFKHYIIATEMRNNSRLVLHFDLTDK